MGKIPQLVLALFALFVAVMVLWSMRIEAIDTFKQAIALAFG